MFDDLIDLDEQKHDIDIDKLIIANTKLVDENRYLKEDKLYFKSIIKKTSRAIEKQLYGPYCDEKQFLKGIYKVINGERSFTIEEMLRYEPDIEGDDINGF